MVLSDERLREKLAQRTRLRNSYMPGSYNYEVEDEIVSAFTELLTRRAAEQQEPDARRKVSLLWLDGYLAELKKTPNRFADDIWELEQIREQFAASPQPPVPPGSGVRVKPLEWSDEGDDYGLASDSLVGRYVIRRDRLASTSFELVLIEQVGEQLVQNTLREGMLSVDTAQAAAQADYEQRIRAALLNGGSHDR